MAATDYDFQSARNKVIERAFRLIGGKSLGEVLNADEISVGIDVLNDMVKSWQSRRIFLWTVKALTQSLTDGNSSYSLAVDPPVINIEKAFLRISDNDHPLKVISFPEYWDIADKSSPGDPTHVALDGRKSQTLYVWPVPNTPRTLYYLAITFLEDWDSASSSEDFPPRWTEALVYGLASRLADEYQLPLSERQHLDGKAEMAFKLAVQGDGQTVTDQQLEPAFLPRRC